MINFILGFSILLDYYFLTGLIIAIVVIIAFAIIIIFDDEALDLEDYSTLALLSTLGFVIVVSGWILIPLFIPFILLTGCIYLGRKLFFIYDGRYNRRRRNLIKENFIYYMFANNDRRQGEDNF
jgi:hypothetical protein